MELLEFENRAFMLTVNEQEATEIIETLAHQLVTKDGNTGRREFIGHGRNTAEPNYFSISLIMDEKEDDLKMQDGFNRVEMEAFDIVDRKLNLRSQIE